MADTNQELEQYLEKVEKLAPKLFFQFSDEIWDVINSTYQDRQGWSLEEIANHIFELHKFEIFLKHEISRHNTKIAYLERLRKNMQGKYAIKYGDKYTKWEERVTRYESEDNYCLKLQELILDCEAYINEIKSHAYGLDNLGKALNNIYYTKKGRHDAS
jgi:hypothetical protein